MRISTISAITPSAAAANNIAASQTPTAALTLSTTSFEMARIVKVTDAGNNTGKNLVIVGTDADGNTITETVAGTSTSSAVTTLAFKTITSITADAAYANAVTVGTVNTTLSGYSYTYPLNYLSEVAHTISVVVTGTINFSVEECFTDILKDGTEDTVWGVPTSLSAKTANIVAQLDKGATGLRLRVNSYTTNATISATIIPGSAH